MINKKLIADEVLFSYDDVSTFTIREENKLYLSHMGDKTEKFNSYLVTEITEEELTLLKSGEMSILDALTKPDVHILVCTNDNRVLWNIIIPFKEVPKDQLPKKSVTAQMNL